MGTTLTGTTPQDTYDSLIKVTDNGPLSGTAKYLSDGLGNDSVLALSTAAVGVGTTSPNIGTWNRALTLNTASGNTAYELAVGGAAQLYLAVDSSNAYLQVANATSPLRIFTGAAERMRITDTGNVGIGTSSPTSKLVVNGDIATSGNIALTGSGAGIFLGGSIGSANGLDDYEEGTFTATLAPSTSGTITLNATYSTWSYTKIGNQVTVNGLAVVSSVSSPVGTYIKIGLPFTVGNSDSKYGGNSCLYSDASLSYAKSLLGGYNPRNTSQSYVYIDASTIATNDEFYFTTTYFV